MNLSELRKIYSKFHYNGLTLDQWKSIMANVLREETHTNKQNNEERNK